MRAVLITDIVKNSISAADIIADPIISTSQCTNRLCGIAIYFLISSAPHAVTLA